MDPLSFLVLSALVAGAVDWGSGGLVRAEVLGGAKGSTRGVIDAWSVKHRSARKRRHKTRPGRFLNAIEDMVVGAFRGWGTGRKAAHAKRKQRYEAEPLPVVRAVQTVKKKIAGPELDPNDSPEQTSGSTPNGGPNNPNATPNSSPEQTPNEQASGPNDDPERDIWQDPKPTGETVCEVARSGRYAGGTVRVRCKYLVLGRGDIFHACGRPTTRPDRLCTEHASLTDQSKTPTPAKEAATMSDLDNAPAYLKAWDDAKTLFEEPEAGIDRLGKHIEFINSSGADFHNGSEADVLGMIQALIEALRRAQEAIDAAANAAHQDLDASIDAASGKAATAHGAMQEA